MGRVILITGISTGFGKETASLLAALGHKVYGTVRSECDVAEGINLLTMDLTDHDSIRKTVRLVVEREGRIDVLVNNGGMHTGGPVETLPEEYIRLQMETSFMGMVRLTREVLPVMRAGGGGRIINISSIGGLMGLPYQGFYSAAKFAVEGFSDALRMEVQQFNIRVVVINPGDFRTNNSANRRKFLAPSGSDDPYAGQFSKSLSVIESDEAGGRHPVLLAKKLARIIECRHPRQRYVIATPDQKLAVILKRIVPPGLFTLILGSHYGISRHKESRR
ncbi:MAG: SDR family oxidoreductase [Bacteroidales bacterium]|nr:SDR family oxidoreductase [Bacteroidales bacterium]MCB9028281.1 SDR family oxidoreductase [Bacteroidales bacterium]HNT93642.1 SDR family oxidoreductase [Bacteroidales bacterium]HPE21512.1 SDR family oxidoreductase [Bacteroidales bacterium]HPJ03932.1 SDR family oxidoreductase [Bacteroidales bacterium]